MVLPLATFSFFSIDRRIGKTPPRSSLLVAPSSSPLLHCSYLLVAHSSLLLLSPRHPSFSLLPCYFSKSDDTQSYRDARSHVKQLANKVKQGKRTADHWMPLDNWFSFSRSIPPHHRLPAPLLSTWLQGPY